MKFEELLQIVADEPVFETGLLLAGDVNPADVRRQLSRWTGQGKLHQLRRGVYTLASPHQKIKAHPFVIANRMAPASYVSLHSALAFYGLVPEYAPVTTSVTTGRPGTWRASLGEYDFRHIRSGLFWGYLRREVTPAQYAFLAAPEKALLDLCYLTPAADDPVYLGELRLQNLTQLDLRELALMAEQSNSPKLQRAAAVIASLAAEEALAYEEL